MKKSRLFFNSIGLKKLKILIFLSVLIYGSIKGQTYVSFQQSEYTVAENTYLDICLEVKGDWNFKKAVGFYMYIEKTYSSGDHFPTVNKELVFIDEAEKCFTFQVGKDTKSKEGKDTKSEDELYKFRLVNYEHQKDIKFSPIDEIVVNVRNIPKAKSLPPRGIFFSGIANTGGANSTTALYLSNAVPLEPGTSFSIVNGTFNSTGNGGGNWTGTSGNPFSTIYVIYVGDQTIEPGNNFCIFITDINSLDIGLGMTISVNGIDRTHDFMISTGGTPNEIKIDINPRGTYYITQGTWYNEKGSYHLMGSVIDGISYGSTKEEVKAAGIPMGLGGDITVVDGVNPIDNWNVKR